MSLFLVPVNHVLRAAIRCSAWTLRRWFGLKWTSSLFSTEANAQSVRRSPELLFTEQCVKRLREVLADDEYLRVMVDSGGCSGFEYKFDVVKQLDARDDHVISKDDVRIVVDSTSLELVRGSTLDFQDELIRSTFRIVKNPNASKGCSCGSSFALKDEPL